MKPVYEVVSGSILLSKREDFFRLHRDWLLPMMHKIGIRPVLLLMTEIGSYGKFLDIYRYDSLAQYEELTDRLLSHPELQSYYAEVGQCILGSISIEIMREMPYAASVIGDEELAEDRQHKRCPSPKPRPTRSSNPRSFHGSKTTSLVEKGYRTTGILRPSTGHG